MIQNLSVVLSAIFKSSGVHSSILIDLQCNYAQTGTLCQPDVDALANNGSVRIDENFDEALTATGREELLLLGRRFRGRFVDFFNSRPYNAQLYQVSLVLIAYNSNALPPPPPLSDRGAMSISRQGSIVLTGRRGYLSMKQFRR